MGMAGYRKYVCPNDSTLFVFVDWSNSNAAVWYQYAGGIQQPTDLTTREFENEEQAIEAVSVYVQRLPR
ncbi:MAG: hypothetical protein EA417_07380 [Gammaproteobacteria bacterium]|nr:MAG: hypothetical protein EA417_07380 [Gammaproteobacteria bacterium]